MVRRRAAPSRTIWMTRVGDRPRAVVVLTRAGDRAGRVHPRHHAVMPAGLVGPAELEAFGPRIGDAQRTGAGAALRRAGAPGAIPWRHLQHVMMRVRTVVGARVGDALRAATDLLRAGDDTRWSSPIGHPELRA